MCHSKNEKPSRANHRTHYFSNLIQNYLPESNSLFFFFVQHDGSYSGTFPPIEEVSEPSSDNESGDASDSSSKAPGNTDSSRPIDGSGNGGGSSNGVRNNGRGRGSSGNVSPPMNSQSKAKVSFDPNVKEAPTNNTGSASQQGVDEVDSGKPKTSLKPAAPTKV